MKAKSNRRTQVTLRLRNEIGNVMLREMGKEDMAAFIVAEGSCPTLPGEIGVRFHLRSMANDGKVPIAISHHRG
jgi:hypothetical protein